MISQSPSGIDVLQFFYHTQRSEERVISFYMKQFLLFRFSAVMILICFALSAHAYKDSPVALYSQLQKLDIDELMKMGAQCDLRNSSDSALVCYSVVADRLRANPSIDKDKQTLCKALNNMGYIYTTFFYDYARALELFQESLELSDKCNYQENKVFLYLNIGGLYLECDRMYEGALFSSETRDYLNKAFEEGLSIRQYDVALVALLNLGQLFLEDKQSDVVVKAIDRLRHAVIRPDNEFYQFTKRYADGLSAYIKGDYDSAVGFFRDAYRFISPTSMHSERLKVIALSAEAETLDSAGKYPEAITTEENVLSNARKSGSADEETRALRKLAALYERSGDSEKAKSYLLQYFHIKDSILTDRDIIMLSKMPFLNELESFKVKITREQAQRTRLLAITAIAILFIIILALYVITLIRGRRKMRAYIKELYRKNMEIVNSTKCEWAVQPGHSDSHNEGTVEKYAASNLTEQESKRIASKILEIMSDTSTITSYDFTMERLADMIGCPYRHVSQVVNEVFGKNFRSLLNEYRIKEACIRLADTEKYGSYTIESIAESLGFNSRSNFSVTFKRITGLTPAQFQKSAIEEK